MDVHSLVDMSFFTVLLRLHLPLFELPMAGDAMFDAGARLHRALALSQCSYCHSSNTAMLLPSGHP